MSERILDNKYIIDHLIGIGRTSFMYKAWDIMLHKFVTVKKIHEEFAKDPEFASVFRNEAVNTARMEHENIVRVVNFIEEGGDFYVVMDYVKGVSLEYLLSKSVKHHKPFSPENAAFIISQVLKALDYAHKLKDEVSGKPYNILHLDISPANIMIFFDGRVKLTDFGIAKKKADDTADTDISAYISPEQAKGDLVSPATDIYCCALVLYEVLTGEKPYGRASSSELIQKAAAGAVDTGALSSRGVPEALISIMGKAMNIEPSERHSDAASMLSDINAFFRNISEKSSSLEKKHSQYVNLMLQDEIRAAEREAQKDLENKYDTRDTSAMMPSSPPQSSPPGLSSVRMPPPSSAPASSSPSSAPGEKEIPELIDPQGVRSQDSASVKASEIRGEPIKDFMTAPTSPLLQPSSPVRKKNPPPPPWGPAAGRPPAQNNSYPPEVEKSSNRFSKERVVLYLKVLAAAALSGFILYALADIRGGREASDAAAIAEAEKLAAKEGSRRYLVTIPPVSRVDIVDDSGRSIIEEMGLEGVTPFDLSQVGFGNYTVHIRREGFGEVTRRLTVSGSAAGKSIRLHNEEEKDGKYVVAFNTDITVQSIPRGAVLYINGSRVGTTPHRLTLEPGRKSFMLTMPGYIAAGMKDPDESDPLTTLGAGVIDTTIPASEQYSFDRRFWSVSESETPTGKRMVVRGFLRPRPAAPVTYE